MRPRRTPRAGNVSAESPISKVHPSIPREVFVQSAGWSAGLPGGGRRPTIGQSRGSPVLSDSLEGLKKPPRTDLKRPTLVSSGNPA
ncbi:hypothetical protein KM043_007975 [Ampulex compressa]|nr:hypothetical protein KM043_007975 [Ampulex compressa]